MIKEYWRKSFDWGGAPMNTEAAANDSDAETVLGHYTSYASAPPPVWVGNAQRVAWADRDLVLERVQQLAQALKAHAQISRETASQVMGWLRSKGELTRYAGSVGLQIIDTGSVFRIESADPQPTDGQLLETIGSVDAFDAGLRQFDADVAERLAGFASSFHEAALDLEAVDRMNRILASQLEGAMDGASWDLQDDYEFILDQIDGPAWFAITEDILRFALEEVGDVPEWLRDYLYDGEIPSPSEVAAFHAYNAALAGYVGKVADAYEWLRDQLEGRWDLPGLPFEIGDGFAEDGSPFHPEFKEAFEDHSSLATLADLMERMNDVYSRDHYESGRGIVEVHVIDQGPGLPPKFLAVIPGTSIPLADERGWHGDPEGTDWPANLRAMGYGNSSAVQSAMAALDAAVRQYETDTGTTIGRADVSLAGHSQAGLIAATIAEDRAFTSRHNVEYLFSAGSPIDHTNPAGGTTGANVGNETDFVPALDGYSQKAWELEWKRFHAVPAGPDGQRSDAYVDIFLEDARYGGPAPGEDPTVFGHSQQTYIDRLRDVTADSNRTTMTDAERALLQMQAEMGDYLTTAESHTTYRYTFGRQ